MDFFQDTSFCSSEYDVFSIFDAPFRIYGLEHDGEMFYRLPNEVAKQSNSGVEFHNMQTAGGRVRFVTDAKELWLSAKMHKVEYMAHFALTGSAGFDIYEEADNNSVYTATIFPDMKNDIHLEGKAELTSNKKRTITINFPTYAGVKDVHIALPKYSAVEAPKEYKYRTPIVFYGSSITQGGCCSRPGNTYQAILSRNLDFDYINLGFSGSARAEDAMIDYLSELKMSAFVLDYDHNAPTAEHLEKTHSKLFNAVRKAQPNLPVLMLSRPKVHLNDEEIRRKNIVKKTYTDAINNGDRNVYFIAGDCLISTDVIECATVDNTHPNDAGFVSMANAIEPVLLKMLK